MKTPTNAPPNQTEIDGSKSPTATSGPKNFASQPSTVTPAKSVTALLFVTLLVLCTTLGAIPGFTPTLAEARNTNANRPRTVQARNTGANLAQRFTANRTSYRVDVGQSTTRATIRIGIATGQQHRWRIDTRDTNGNWRNASYNSWRTRNTRNTNRDIRVNVSQGQERRLRIQIRDRQNNVRTITINVQRASGNTQLGEFLRSNAGTIDHANRTVTIPHNRNAVTQVSAQARIERNMTRNRVRVQNAQGVWQPWSAWTSYTRGLSNRNVPVIPQGRRAEVQYMVRGAWTNRSHTPLRTTIHTVTVIRPDAPTGGNNNQPGTTNPQNVRTVTFNSQGGSAVPSRQVQAGNPIGTLPTPTRAGHVFEGWFTSALQGGSQWNANTIVNNNVTIHARWRVQGPVWTPGTHTITVEQAWAARGGQGHIHLPPGFRLIQADSNFCLDCLR